MTIRPLAAAFLVAAAAGCGDTTQNDPYYGPMIYDVLPDTARGVSQDPDDPELLYRMFELKGGYVAGAVAEYADFGPVNTVLPNVYILVRDNVPIEGQYPIVDTLPDKAEYSSFWHVVEVEAPSGYVANSLKSLNGLEKNDLKMRDTGKARYCPIVNPDAAWIGVDGAQYNVFYGTGEPIPNPEYVHDLDAGVDDAGKPVPPPSLPPVLTDTASTEADIRLQPIWHKRLSGFCVPGMLDKQRDRLFKAEKVKDEETQEEHWELSASEFGARYDQYTPLEQTDGEFVSWELPSIFGAGPDRAGYSPAVLVQALFTEMPTEIDTVEGLDVTEPAALEVLDNPIFRTIAIPEPEETTDGDEAMQ